MSVVKPRENRPQSLSNNHSQIRIEREFRRFNIAQRWEHGILLLSFTTLVLTGLPQKYFASWGHYVLTTPQTLLLDRQIHRVAAVVLILEVIYHLIKNVYLLFSRRLRGDMLPNVQDLRDAWQMIKYLLFLSKEKPAFGKYNFEQKFTYWFLFFGIGLMVITGLILWFPIVWTRVFPGGTIPAAQLAHSSEAIAATVFVLIWHFYHVHFERLNLSIFTGRLNERDMRIYHAREFERITGEPANPEQVDNSEAK